MSESIAGAKTGESTNTTPSPKILALVDRLSGAKDSISSWVEEKQVQHDDRIARRREARWQRFHDRWWDTFVVLNPAEQVITIENFAARTLKRAAFYRENSIETSLASRKFRVTNDHQFIDPLTFERLNEKDNHDFAVCVSVCRETSELNVPTLTLTNRFESHQPFIMVQALDESLLDKGLAERHNIYDTLLAIRFDQTW